MKEIFPKNGEFNFIKKIAEKQSSFLNNSNDVYGIGDDAAIVGNLAISVDSSIEGVHFSLDWSTIGEAFEKALISNISDINAMGTTAKFALLALGIPKNWNDVQKNELLEAVNSACLKYKIDLIGGDTVAAGDDKCFFSITIIGELENKALLRSAAKPGHSVYVSNNLGKSLAGLKLLEKNDLDLFPELIKYHKVPELPINLGSALSKLPEMGACIDISDGLQSELLHISLQSEVKIEIYEEKFGFDQILMKFCSHFGDSLSSFYLNSGEEYQLVFTMPKEMETFLKEFNICEIGCVSQGNGVNFISSDGTMKILDSSCWSHL